jgi:hypothetical protein
MKKRPSHHQGINMKKRLVLSFLALSSLCAFAQESKWSLVTAIGWANGGEEIISGVIIDRNNTARTIPYAIKAGSGLQVRLGPEYRFNDAFSVQATVGRSVNDPMGDNGSLTFTTTPLEMLANYKPTKNVRVGLGARKTYADLKGTGVAANYPILGSYNGSLGSVLEFSYLVPISNHAGSTFGAYVRFVNEKLKFQQFELNGNHYELGIAAQY